MTKRSEKLYVKDMADAIGSIEQYTRGISFKKFSCDRMVVDAVVRNFEIIGEAAKHISRKQNPAIRRFPGEK